MDELKPKVIDVISDKIRLDIMFHDGEINRKTEPLLTQIVDTVKEYVLPQLPSPCTPKQYKEITGKDYPDDCLVWVLNPMEPFELKTPYKLLEVKENEKHLLSIGCYYKYDLLIVQTGQPAPPSDWRLE